MPIFTVPDTDSTQGPAGSPGALGTGDYGSVSGADMSVSVALPAFGSTLVPLTTNGVFNNMTPDQANNRLIAGALGVWEVGFGVTFTASAFSVCRCRILRNGVIIRQIMEQHTGATWRGHMACSGTVILAPGDVLVAQFFPATAVTITFLQSQLYAKRLS